MELPEGDGIVTPKPILVGQAELKALFDSKIEAYVS